MGVVAGVGKALASYFPLRGDFILGASCSFQSLRSGQSFAGLPERYLYLEPLDEKEDSRVSDLGFKRTSPFQQLSRSA